MNTLRLCLLALCSGLGSFVACTQARDQCQSAQDCFKDEQCINARCGVALKFEPSQPQAGPIADSAQLPLTSFSLLMGAKRGPTLLGQSSNKSFVTWSWSGFKWELRRIREDLNIHQLTPSNYYISPDDVLHILYVDQEFKLKHLYSVKEPDGSERWEQEEIDQGSSEQELLLPADLAFDTSGERYICAYRGDILKGLQTDSSLELVIYSDKSGTWEKLLEDQGDHGFFCNIQVEQGVITIYERASNSPTPRMLTTQWVQGVTMPEFSFSILEGAPFASSALFENEQRELLLIHSSHLDEKVINLSYQDLDRWHTERLYELAPTRIAVDMIPLKHPDRRSDVTLFLYEVNQDDGRAPKFIRIDKRAGQLRVQEELLDGIPPENIAAVMDKTGLLHMITQGPDKTLYYQTKP